jgi:hypothetical protein
VATKPKLESVPWPIYTHQPGVYGANKYIYIYKNKKSQANTKGFPLIQRLIGKPGVLVGNQIRPCLVPQKFYKFF